MFGQRRPKAKVRLASTMLLTPNARFGSVELGQAAGVRTATVLGIFADWHDRGWLTDEWQYPDAGYGKRGRRFYRITPAGFSTLTALWAAAA